MNNINRMFASAKNSLNLMNEMETFLCFFWLLKNALCCLCSSFVYLFLFALSIKHLGNLREAELQALNRGRVVEVREKIA
jgi:hypothetical protein